MLRKEKQNWIQQVFSWKQDIPVVPCDGYYDFVFSPPHGDKKRKLFEYHQWSKGS